MKPHRYALRIAMMAGCLFFFNVLNTPFTAFAVDDEYSRESLKGIKGIYVLVGGLNPPTIQAGFSKTQIQRDMELKLRLGGIATLTQDQYLGIKGHPYLYVTLNALNIPEAGNLIVYYIEIILKQDVILGRDKTIQMDTGTWSINKLGATHRVKQIRDELKNFIDEFLAAHRMANPQ